MRDTSTRCTHKLLTNIPIEQLLISLIFVSDTDNIQCHGTLLRIADHEGVFVNFHCIRQKSKTATRKIYYYKNIDETHKYFYHLSHAL